MRGVIEGPSVLLVTAGSDSLGVGLPGGGSGDLADRLCGHLVLVATLLIFLVLLALDFFVLIKLLVFLTLTLLILLVPVRDGTILMRRRALSGGSRL